jgi:hypothetical protein
MTYKEYDNIFLENSDMPCLVTSVYHHTQNAPRSYYVSILSTFPPVSDAPTNITTSRTLFSAPGITGIITQDKYLYTNCYYNGKTRILRIDTDTDEILYTDIGDETLGLTYAVLDYNRIVIHADNKYEIYNIETGERFVLAFLSPQHERWGIINNMLTISQKVDYWDYDTDPIIHRHYDYWLYNIITPDLISNATGNWEVGNAIDQDTNATCTNLILENKFFYVYNLDNYDTDYPGADPETTSLFIVDIDVQTMTRIRPLYDGGNMSMYHLTYNPVDQMLYFISEHWHDIVPPPDHVNYAIGKMNPDDYSYEYIYNVFNATNAPQAHDPALLLGGETGIYMMTYDGSVYNILDTNTILASLPTTVSHGGALQRPQSSDIAMAIDGENRIWYAEPPYIKAISLDDGNVVINHNAGIAALVGTYPTYPVRQVYLGGNKVFVLNSNASGNSIIYEIS